MMDRKIKRIDYIDGHKVDGDILVPVLKYEEIMMTGTKRFHNCLYLILGLGRLERVLMDWVSEEMDKDNMVRNDFYNRKNFIDFISNIEMDGKKNTYIDSSVNTAFSMLQKSGLLISVSKGVYKVNPKYYWNGTDKDRVNQIMVNLEFASANTNFRVIPNGKDFQIVKKGK